MFWRGDDANPCLQFCIMVSFLFTVSCRKGSDQFALPSVSPASMFKMYMVVTGRQFQRPCEYWEKRKKVISVYYCGTQKSKILDRLEIAHKGVGAPVCMWAPHPWFVTERVLYPGIGTCQSSISTEGSVAM